jgi:alkylation response protein AidB-like acyl-CoA dehydrogenase
VTLAAEFTEEQRRFRQAVIEFAQGDLAKHLGPDRDGGFAREAWNRCAEFGLQGLPVPVRYGGLESDATTMAIALEALGYGCPDSGLIFALNAQLWGCESALVAFGSEEQKQRYLPGLCDGSIIGGHGVSEPESGSDAFSLRTTARESDGGYVLDGAKTFVTNAPHADLLVVFATIDRELGFAGLCAFLVDRDTPGLTIGPPLRKMGLRTAPMAELFLEDCAVGADRMLGAPGAGMAIFNTSLQWERGLVLAGAVGAMQRQLERCVAYARERRQFGQPIGRFQAVAHRIVDMQLRLETSRQLLYRFARLTDQGRATVADSALVKLHLSDSFLQSSLDAVQVHGGYGYMSEYELEHDVRDAVGGRLYAGTSEIQRNLVARQLGLG